MVLRHISSLAWQQTALTLQSAQIAASRLSLQRQLLRDHGHQHTSGEGHEPTHGSSDVVVEASQEVGIAWHEKSLRMWQWHIPKYKDMKSTMLGCCRCCRCAPRCAGPAHAVVPCSVHGQLTRAGGGETGAAATCPPAAMHLMQVSVGPMPVVSTSSKLSNSSIASHAALSPHPSPLQVRSSATLTPCRLNSVVCKCCLHLHAHRSKNCFHVTLPVKRFSCFESL